MISILIKSFNRPFYLDRSLNSMFRFVEGDFLVKVLDDGTPEKYLNKIQKQYPEIEILKSKNYKEKSKLVDQKSEINGFEIPTDLWITAANEADDYVLVIEDDVWFTGKINLNQIVSEMKNYKIDLVKLGWLGNYKDDKHVKVHSLTENLDATIPKNLFTSNQFVMDLFMYNKFKFFTILYKFGLVDNETKRKYWILNSILMGLWKKEYWLQIWKDADGKVDEKQQLRNAAAWFHKNKQHENLIARTKSEYLKTTFQSSATNSYHRYGFDFDVDYFNFLINEAWFRNEFDSMQDYPNDFSVKYFEQFFDEKIKKEEFRKWIEKFKQQYRNLGAEVD